ncbi:MAG: hypothetical protein ACK5HA_10365 [Planctomycetaceae bacterium]|jgi:peptidoglycan hydrolase CwlO-like protein
MASSKPTGLHYALVILSLLTIVCGVFWILNHKWLNEAKETTQRAQADQKKATDALNKMLNNVGELKKVLGITFEEVGDDESNINTVRGHIRERLKKEAGDLGATTYEDLLIKLQAALKNTTGVRDDLQKQLQTEQVTFNNKVTELQSQMAEQKKARDLADQGKSEVVKTHEEELTSMRTDLEEERRRLAETEQANEELQAKFDQFKKAKTQEIENLRLLNKRLTTDLNSAKQVSFEVPKGQIVKVDAVSRKVWINRGSVDGLRPRTTFSVYIKDHSGVGREAAKGAKGPEDVKGSIEVTKVDARISEARIIPGSEDLSRPIASGDPIYTPLWSPGRGESFSFVGVADIDGDGRADLDLLNELVTNAGGTIDNLVNEKGQLYINGELSEGGEPKISEKTKFLVKGKLPELANARDKEQQAELLRMNELMTSLERQAYERGVRLISLSDFLSFVGYTPQKRLFVPGGEYTLKAGSRDPAVESSNRTYRSGDTSGAFSGTQRPKPNSFTGGETSRSR